MVDIPDLSDRPPDNPEEPEKEESSTGVEVVGMSYFKDHNYDKNPEKLTRLKGWHVHAIMLREMYGYRWEEIGERLNKSGNRIKQIVERSPAAKELRKKVVEMLGNPQVLARIMLEANVVNATVDMLTALQWAREKKDYNAVARMTKDMLALGGIEPQSAKAVPQEIVVHLGTGSLEQLKIKTSYKKSNEDIEEADWETEEGD